VSGEQEPRWLVEQKARIEKAYGPFVALARGYLGLDVGGYGTGSPPNPLYRKVERAWSALREWRHANNQQPRYQDEMILTIRITAETMAEQVASAAGGRADLDPDTIAWVLAGMRCTARPFCAGCDTCFTITSPGRHAPEFDPAR
jgi:hypothetical protein